MNLGEKAYKKLFPGRELKRAITIKYSRRFKPYNANVRHSTRKIEFGFSHYWEPISDEIKIGLAQHLLLKVFKEKRSTVNTELYEKFMENLPRYIMNNGKTEPELEASFERVNRKYFDGFLERPALEWGTHSTTQLGLYTYATDTVRISRIFQGLPRESRWMLDYLMYHELLHKKFGMKYNNGSCRHHTPEFKKWESKFRIEGAENKLSAFVRTKKRRKKLRNIYK